MSLPEAVIIDLDGTLVDSVPDLAYALNAVLMEDGHPELAVDIVRNMIGGGIPKLLERGLRAHDADSSEEAVAQRLPRMIEIYEANATKNTRLYPGCEELLKALKARSIPMALCTNKPTEATHIIMNELGIADYFDVIVGGTSGFPKKPDPRAVNHILSELDVKAENVLMIGDSKVDLGAARNVGAPIALMTYGYSKTPVSELGADHVFDSFTEIVDFLGLGTTAQVGA